MATISQGRITIDDRSPSGQDRHQVLARLAAEFGIQTTAVFDSPCG